MVDEGEGDDVSGDKKGDPMQAAVRKMAETAASDTDRLIQNWMDENPGKHAMLRYTVGCRVPEVMEDTMTPPEPTPDDGVAAPSHYVEGRKYEPHLVIEDWGLNHNAGSVMKYIARYLLKGNPIKDLRKARRYLDFEIERLEGEK